MRVIEIARADGVIVNSRQETRGGPVTGHGVRPRLRYMYCDSVIAQ